MRNIRRRAAEIARSKQKLEVVRIAASLRERLGDVRVEEEGQRVTVSGRGLMRRWLVDPALRFAAGDLR